MRFSTTLLDTFRFWRAHPERKPEAELVAAIKGDTIPTPAMLLGEAWGRILERPHAYVDDYGYSYGHYRFERADVERALAVIPRHLVVYLHGQPVDVQAHFEAKTVRQYGPHTVVAKVDHILGADINEFKVRQGTVRLDRYAASCQWRFYLDAFHAETVTYHVFQLSARRRLRAIESLLLARYPRLHDDCAELVEAFAHYVRRRGLEAYLPDKVHELVPRIDDGPRFEDSPTTPAPDKSRLRELRAWLRWSRPQSEPAAVPAVVAPVPRRALPQQLLF